jgi:transcription elongation factor Elf1
MSFEWLSEFECACCGAASLATTPAYNRLGFALCDRCGAETGPRPLCN